MLMENSEHVAANKYPDLKLNIGKVVEQRNPFKGKFQSM